MSSKVKKSDVVIPAMTFEAKVTVCSSIALNAVNTEKRIETAMEMEEQVKLMREQLGKVKADASSSYKALIAQIKTLHKDAVPFGKMPKGKKVEYEMEKGKFIIPEDASIGSILFHKFVENKMAEGSAYNMCLLLKFSIENGVMPELGQLNYTKFLATAQSTGLPCLEDGKTRKAFIQYEKGKYTATLPKTDEPKTDAPKSDAPKSDAPKSDAPKSDAPKSDAPKSDAGKSDAGKSDAGKSANTAVPKIVLPRAGKQKSFVDNILAAMVDDQGMGGLLLAYLQYVDGQGANPNNASEAFVLFVETMENAKHIVCKDGKVSKLIP